MPKYIRYLPGFNQYWEFPKLEELESMDPGFGKSRPWLIKRCPFSEKKIRRKEIGILSS